MRVPIFVGRLVLMAASWLLLSGSGPARVDVTQPHSVDLVDSGAFENLPIWKRPYRDFVTGPFAAVTDSGFTPFDPTVYNGRSFDTRTVASDGHTLALGGSDGLLTVDLGTGTKTFYDIPSARAIVFADSDGSIIVGMGATAPDQSLILRCDNGECLPSASGPTSLKAGDVVDGFTVVPDGGTYAYGTGFYYATDNKTFTERRHRTARRPAPRGQLRERIVHRRQRGRLVGRDSRRDVLEPHHGRIPDRHLAIHGRDGEQFRLARQRQRELQRLLRSAVHVTGL